MVSIYGLFKLISQYKRGYKLIENFKLKGLNLNMKFRSTKKGHKANDAGLSLRYRGI